MKLYEKPTDSQANGDALIGNLMKEKMLLEAGITPQQFAEAKQICKDFDRTGILDLNAKCTKCRRTETD